MFTKYIYLYGVFHEKTNIVDSALCIDVMYPKHAAQANQDRHCSHPEDFLYQESLLYTAIPLTRNVSAWFACADCAG